MISIGKLVKKSDGHESIAEIISTICKYGREVRHVVNHILSPNEQVFYSGKQHRYVPRGREITPGQIYVTNQGVIIVSTEWLGLKKNFDLHYSDILGIDLKKNVFSCDLIIRSRFQGDVHIRVIGKDDAPSLERIKDYRFGGGGTRSGSEPTRKVM